MGFVDGWDEFAGQAQELFLSHPLRTRYSFKYRAKEGTLVLKVTDDVVCLKYKTTQRSDLRKIEILTEWMMNLMSAMEDEADLEKLANDPVT